MVFPSNFNLQKFYELFTGFDMEQHIAYHIGQVGCLKLFYKKKTAIYVSAVFILETTYTHMMFCGLPQAMYSISACASQLSETMHLKIHQDVRNESK